MQGFEDVRLTWKGEEYIVPASRQMMLIAKIEDALDKGDGTPPVAVLLRGASWSRIARAFGEALRYAGVKVTDEEIYLSITAGMAQGDFSEMVRMRDATIALLSIMAPPIAMAFRGEDDAPGE